MRLAKGSKKEEEFYETYVIPMNFDNGARIFGFIKLWNAIEAVIICGGLGFFEYKIFSMFSMSITNIVAIMSITLIPLGVLTIIGVEGCDLLRFGIRMIKSMKNRKYIVRREMYNSAIQEKRTRDGR